MGRPERALARMAGVLLASATLLLSSSCALLTSARPHGAAPRDPSLLMKGGVVRHDLRFPCGDATCAAWLYVAPGAEASGQNRRPVVVMAHGFAGTRDIALDEVGADFARAELNAFVFDYRHFGDSGGSPRQLIDPWRQLDDWRAAIDAVKRRPEVDARRIVLWSSSQGGGHALLVASGREDVRAVVAQVPLVDTSPELDPGEQVHEDELGWAVRMLFTAWADLAWSLLSGDSITVPAIGKHDEFAYLPDDAAWAAFEQLTEGGSTYRNAVVARSVLTYDEYDPSSGLADVRCPVLLIASPEDGFVPYSASRKAAEEHEHIELATISGSHFDVYRSPGREQAVGLALAFFRRVLAD